MKKEIKKNNDKTGSSESPESPARRKIIKKAAYIAPTIIVLGVLSPIEAMAQVSGLPPPPPPPGESSSSSIPDYQPKDQRKKK